MLHRSQTEEGRLSQIQVTRTMVSKDGVEREGGDHSALPSGSTDSPMIHSVGMFSPTPAYLDLSCHRNVTVF